MRRNLELQDLVELNQGWLPERDDGFAQRRRRQVYERGPQLKQVGYVTPNSKSLWLKKIQQTQNMFRQLLMGAELRNLELSPYVKCWTISSKKEPILQAKPFHTKYFIKIYTSTYAGNF